MTLVLIEVPDEAAVEALRQQKNIQVVGIVTPTVDAPSAPAPRKWAGALSDAGAESLHAHVKQLRSEWERDT